MSCEQADVGTLGCLDGTHPPVLGVVHVPDFESRPLAREPTRSEGAEAPLVGELRQRVGLVHELRQLRTPEEGLDHCAHGPGVHQIVQRDLLRVVVDAHSLLDEPRHPRQPHRELVGDELTHRPDPPVAQVVDVVRVPATLGELQQIADDGHEVLAREDRVLGRHVDLETLIDLVAPDSPQVVPLRVEEQALERRAGGLEVGGLTGAQQRVDLLQRIGLGRGRILGERILDHRRLTTGR